jgi:hypothetical protein
MSRRLPRRGNFETIAAMNMFGHSRCLLVATAALFAATLPLVGMAQDEVTNEAPAASQQTPQRRYVSDKLVLNVYAGAEQGSERVATIQTGDEVEEIERDGNLVHVRLADGREGWVGSNYLTGDVPAAARLRELERERKSTAPAPDKALSDEIALLKKDNIALKARVKELQTTVATPVAAVSAPVQMIPTSAPVEIVNEPREPASVPPSIGMSLGWLIVVALAGAAGFAGGYQMLARRLRKKFGALKVY